MENADPCVPPPSVDRGRHPGNVGRVAKTETAKADASGSHAAGEASAAAGDHRGRGGHSTFSTAAHATLHCLTGCATGEILGVVLGAWIGFGVWGRMGLGTLFAFVLGLALAARSVAARESMPMPRALKTIFWGEVASIAAMELAMNGADYWFGGAAASLGEWRFWAGFVVMLPAGYAAALPVNAALIRAAVKDACH